MEITVDATGDAPAGAVWERYMNPERWSSWAPQIRSVECPDLRLGPGTTGRVNGPVGVTIDFEVAAVDEAEWTWTWNAWWKHRSVGLELTHGVTTRSTGSRTWLRISGSPILVIPYAPVAKYALFQLVRA